MKTSASPLMVLGLVSMSLASACDTPQANQAAQELDKSPAAVAEASQEPQLAATLPVTSKSEHIAMRIDELTIQRDPNSEDWMVDLVIDRQEVARVLGANDQGKLVVPDDSGDVGAAGKGAAGIEFEEVENPAESSVQITQRVFRARLALSVSKMLMVISEFNQVSDRRIATFVPGGHALEQYKDLPRIDISAFLAGQIVTFKDLSSLAPLKSLGANPTPVRVENSLMITDLGVIEDPVRTANPCASAEANDGYRTWSFQHLMTEMSLGSGLSPGEFTERWLAHWGREQIVNAPSAPHRILDADSAIFGPALQSMIIDPWRKRSGGGTLDLRVAPFRLLNVMYRPDLAEVSPYSGPSEKNGGELRFVFGMMDVQDNNGDGDALDPEDTCTSIESSVIFEYKVPLSECEEIKDWANLFIGLSSQRVGSEGYNQRLEGLTERVVSYGADPHGVNQNAIGQVRTNEFVFGPIWQLREFVLDPRTRTLVQTTTKENPREHRDPETASGSTPNPLDLNGTDIFFNEVQNNLDRILRGTYSTPEFSQGQPYLAGSVSYGFRTHWDHPDFVESQQREARFRVSVNTCSGCHTGETNTTFYHVRPTPMGSEPELSRFLTEPGFTRTIDTDPNAPQLTFQPRRFDERAARTQALHRLANQVCGFNLGLFPFQISHIPLRSQH